MTSRFGGFAPLLCRQAGRFAPSAAGCGLGFLFGLAHLVTASPLVAAEIRISGRVLLLGAPRAAVAHARVELDPAADGYDSARRWLAGGAAAAPLAATHPEADGSFALLAPQPGCYRLTVRADGYLPLRYPLSPLVEDREVPAARLQPATRSTIEARGEIGEPLPGVLFGVWTPLGELSGARWDIARRSGRTGADGRLTLARGPDEELWAISIDPRYEGQMARLGDPAARLLLHRPRLIALEARDPEGKPVAGALLRRGGGQPVAVAGDDGRVDLAVDEAALAATSSAMTVESPAGDLWAEVTAKQLRRGPIRITLAPLSAVAGELIDASSRLPIAGGLVWSTSAELPPITVTAAGPDGRFRLRLPAGSSVQLNAAAPGYLAAKTAVRRSAAALPPVRVELTRAATLSGEIVDRAGATLAGAEVTVVEMTPEREPMETFVADRNGRFRLSSLTAGLPYYLYAHAPGFAPALRVVHAPAAAALAPPGAPSTAAPSSPLPKPMRIVLEPGVSIVGRVADSAGRPLHGIHLHLSPTEGASSGISYWRGEDALRTERSGPAGAFEFAHLVTNRYRLRATSPSFAPWSRADIEVSGRTPRIDLGTLTLQAGGVIDAQVVDSRGAPVPAAPMVLSASGVQEALALEDSIPSSAMTGPDGKVRFADLVPGARYDLAIHHPEHPVLTVRGIAIPTSGPLRIELQEGHQLTGRVVDTDGLPIAGAAIGVIGTMQVDSLNPMGSREARTDPRGEFTLSGLAAGAVQIQALADGFRRTRAAGLIPEAEPARPLEIVLEPAGWLAGSVRDTAGKPVDAMISVEPQRSPSLSTFDWIERSQIVATEAGGIYRVEGLDPGAYVVTAEPTRRLGSAKQGTPIEIRPGPNALDLVVVPAKTWEVSGQVVDTAGNPVDGVSLQLTPVSAPGNPFTTSLADGSFIFTEVADGTYTPSAHRRGYLMAPGTAPVTVAGGPVSGVQLTLSRTEATISGRLLRLAPAEMAGLRIDAKRLGPDNFDLALRNSFPIEPGSSAVDPASGTYQLTELTAGLWSVTATAAAGRHAAGRVDVDSDTAQAVLDLDFATGAILSGQVTMAKRAVAGAVVTLRSRDNQVAMKEEAAETAADGTFTLPSAPLGTSDLVIVDLPIGLIYHRTVELAGDQALAIALPGGAVHGTITASGTGLPVAGAYVVLTRSELSFGALAGSPAAQTDDAGAFDIAAIAPGQYQVTATGAGLAAGQTTVDVLPDGIAKVTLQLVPSSTAPARPADPGPPGSGTGL